jgi:hypothetical protein
MAADQKFLSPLFSKGGSTLIDSDSGTTVREFERGAANGMPKPSTLNTERRGNNYKRFEDSYLRARAKIWP